MGRRSNQYEYQFAGHSYRIDTEHSSKHPLWVVSSSTHYLWVTNPYTISVHLAKSVFPSIVMPIYLLWRLCHSLYRMTHVNHHHSTHNILFYPYIFIYLYFPYQAWRVNIPNSIPWRFVILVVRWHNTILHHCVEILSPLPTSFRHAESWKTTPQQFYHNSLIWIYFHLSRQPYK